MPPAGSERSIDLAPLLARLEQRAGDALLAVVLSGSHATGEAAWAHIGARSVSLSDLDLYVILSNEAACARARGQDLAATDAPASLVPALLGPLEVAYVTPEWLSRLPARPGTLTLRQRGRVLVGDEGILERVPQHSAQDISREERLLLLENRGAELLGAGLHPEIVDETRPWRIRHTTLKVALDLAGSLALVGGRWPLDMRSRAQAGEAILTGESDRSGGPDAWSTALPGLWREAIAWRVGPAEPLDTAQRRAEWNAVVRAWCACWWRIVAGAAPRTEAPWRMLLANAARSPLPRRLRRAVDFRARVGQTPSLGGRLQHAAAGEPVHRLGGTVAALLFAAALAPEQTTLSEPVRRVIAALGVADGAAWGSAASHTWRTWLRWVAGQAEPS